MVGLFLGRICFGSLLVCWFVADTCVLGFGVGIIYVLSGWTDERLFVGVLH